MKTRDDVKQDMSDLYNELRSGAVDLKTAAELANIAGKFLKVEQLDLAEKIFMSRIPGWDQPKLVKSAFNHGV